MKSDQNFTVPRLMSSLMQSFRRSVLLCALLLFGLPSYAEQPTESSARPTLSELREIGRERSRYRDSFTTDVQPDRQIDRSRSPQAGLAKFESTIKPLLQQNCIDCHGPDTVEGNMRIDKLDPDLLTGNDTEWWLDVFAAITKGEMPPPDSGEMADEERGQLVDWLAAELQSASIARRRSGKHTAFRRMTRYEYNYALQDLLGLPWDFAKDLPPEAHSEEGFQNGADLLHLSVMQFETYHRIARNALRRATVTGDQPPTRYWSIAMKDAAAREWPKQDSEIKKRKDELENQPEKLAEELERLQKRFRAPPNVAHYKERSTGRTARAEWQYGGARYAFASRDQPLEISDDQDCVAILPNGHGPRLIFELGNQLPDHGTMRVTVKASQANPDGQRVPNLQLLFGWQASNEGRALLRVSDDDTPVTARPDKPQTIQWDIELGEIYPRNTVRTTSPMGATPSPSEYIRLINSSASHTQVQIDSVQVAAPVYDQWPPASHRRIFGDGVVQEDESSAAREIIGSFMRRAWRRPIDERELEHKLDLFTTMRPQSESFEEAVIEVLATVLSSPQFLYVTQTAETRAAQNDRDSHAFDAYALANRLSLFLWSSIPDQELLRLAESGELHDRNVLASQVRRMLGDRRSERFTGHFVHQWLDMQLLDFQNFKQHIRGFDPLLKEAMQHEPVALFRQVLRDDASVMDFIHCDYVWVNERLSRHYGFPGVVGNEFRRVSLGGDARRGGILTQAGLLAMNSDWPDSHPLKRAIWLLESLLADPPPPPPPAVPQIDLADPEIAKMTLKERIEDHRNHAACLSCHIKIDPWGIAFENYDALGKWRDQIKGKPVDASSELFNHQKLEGMEGLKRFLLAHRQDQFVRAMVAKLTTYALGRPLAFSDRAQVDRITARVRFRGDGLRTAIEEIVLSDLFQSP